MIILLQLIICLQIIKLDDFITLFEFGFKRMKNKVMSWDAKKRGKIQEVPIYIVKAVQFFHSKFYKRAAKYKHFIFYYIWDGEEQE